MDFVIAHFIKMLTENYKMKCEYIRELDRGILVIKHLDHDIKKFIISITCSVVTGCTIERDNNGAIVKQNISRENKQFVQDYGPGAVRIIFTDDNYGIRVNVLDARLREYFTSDQYMNKFYHKASSL